MDRSTVSACHSLKIIPVHRLSRFARVNSRVYMLVLGEADDAEAVPGTVKVSTTSENGVTKKKITYSRSDVSPDVADILQGYKVTRIIATYVDESGKTRVAGTVDFPLSLDFTTADGVFSVTLSGEDTAPDAFLAE